MHVEKGQTLSVFIHSLQREKTFLHIFCLISGDEKRDFGLP